MDSLIYQLPKIVDEGKKEVEKILERLSGSNKISLQTNELVLPSKDSNNLWSGRIPQQKESDWMNRLIYGDNLLAMQTLLVGDKESGLPSMRGKIDLIYIDPPFDSRTDYRTKVKLPGADLEQKPTVIEQFAYADTWKDGTASYLKMLYPRLALMKELLSEKGSIYVHIDWHIGHYVKLLLDDIFGKEKFVNQIIWKRTFSHGDSGQGAKHLGRLHDFILLYKKSDDFIMNSLYTPYSEKYINDFYKYTDKDGRKYRLVTMTGPGGASKGNPYYEVMGVKRYWMYSQKNMEELIKNGEVIQTNPGTVPQRIKYLDEGKGVPLQDLWMDISPIQGQANENVNYATQKPEELLKRIISLSTNENSIVADFFAGSGTTGAIAERMGRKWIMSDLGKPASLIMRKRLIDQNAKPFLYQSIGDYQKEALASSGLYRRIGDLSSVVAQLYGAIPFTEEQNPNRNLGYIKDSRTLIMVDSPNKLTGLATLKKAIEYRNSFMGGWNKVIVLGWNFTYDITEAIQSLNDDKLEVLVIPPDLLDQLKTKANYKDLIDNKKIRFSSLQYLTIKPIIVESISETEEKLKIELEDYVLLSPDNIPLDEKDKDKLKEIIAKDPLSLIEYWSIDPDYDGETFRSKWQDYRENIENDSDPYHVISKTFLILPKKENRKICVKAVDVFGFESIVIEKL
ncbi:site-specific DNA-methyltransferase [bacterium]|nr:site-specific DNA-methyltransferase [bacterium]